MRLSDLIAGEALEVAAGDPDGCRASDITEDSRTVMPGSLFIARAGAKADGRRFVPDAVLAGATAILTDDAACCAGLPKNVVVLVSGDVPGATARLAERFFGDPSSKLFLVGITGTNGKTTVTHVVHHLLNAAGVRCGMIGTVEIDDGRGRGAADMTTPGAIEVSRTLSVMVEHGCRAAVMEVSSHALDQGRAAALRFDAGVITNITRDHLDYHGTMEAYAAAKARLFGLVDAKGKGPKLSILNADDPDAAAIAGVNRMACTVSGDAVRGWSGRVVSSTPDGMRLAVRGPGVVFEQRVGFLGRHNASNLVQACAAVAAALRTVGMAERDLGPTLQRGLSLVHPPAGRLEPVHGAGDDVCVFVDYAHTDDALDRTLAGVKASLSAGAKLWAVFGAGGQRDAGKRPRMGRAAALRADRVVLTSDNPRGESPASIIADVLAGVPEALRTRVEVHADRARAIGVAIERAAPGDVIVIAGKGHERVQVVRGEDGALVSRPFHDAGEARDALAKRRAEKCSGIGAGQPA